MQIIAKTFAGLEEVLAQELRNLGAQEVVLLKRGVQFEGDTQLLYQANLELRTALRILVPIKTFHANHENILYRKVRQVDWSNYLGLQNTFAIDAVTHSPHFKHSKYVALKSKDAIVDQFRHKLGKRPNVDTKNPDLRIHIHINQNKGTVLLDSSGEPLYKRGYRQDTLAAPINEVLAAGILLLSGWQGDKPLIDPMCGSGTIPIEAALLATQTPPLIFRQQFGFMKWKDFDANLWQKVNEVARAKIHHTAPPIFGYDKDFKAIRVSQYNAIAAKVDGKIQFERKSFESLIPTTQNGLLLSNPPYDERLNKGNINALYKTIGDQLKKHFAGFEAWIISSNMEAFKHVGLRPSKKIPLFNGPLECKLQKYELYRGSKKGTKK